jgi:hypothetical protein
MTKPVEDMTAEEIAAERLELLAQRAALEAGTALVDPPENEEGDGESTPGPWPHATMSMAGHVLEVRKPDESALLGISMTGAKGLSPQVQARIFSQFLANHLSTDSLAVVLESMVDPDSELDVQALIQALTQLP